MAFTEIMDFVGSINQITEMIFNQVNLYTEIREMELLKKKKELERFEDRKNRRYILLYNEIFAPLYRNIVNVQFYGDSCLKELVFTGESVETSYHYEEGLEHLSIDLPNFSVRFTDIKDKIKIYNTDINLFQDVEFEEIVTKYLIENGFSLSKGVKNNPIGKTILIDYLMDHLRSYWFTNEQFELNNWGDHFWRIKGSAIISSDEEYEIKDHVEYLKNLDEIKNKIESFKFDMKNIILKGQKLSVDIGQNIMRYIENGEYNTQCKFCENYIRNG